MNKFVCVLCVMLSITLLLSGCSLNPKPTPSDTVSGNPFEEHDENTDGVLRMTHGAISPDPEKGVFTYDGEPLQLTYMLYNEGSKAEWGFVIYVNGVMQPYTVEGKDGESTCHVFTIEKQTRKDLKISFVPVTGKAGEELSIIYATMLMPSYVLPEEKLDNGYGYYHAYNMSLPMKLIMKKDAPNKAVISTVASKYEIGEIPSWAEGVNVTDAILESEGNCIYVKNSADTTFNISIAGRGDQKYRVSFYINHKLVSAFNGYSYLDVDVKKNKLITISATVSPNDMTGAKFAYAVIVPIMERFSLDAPQIVKTISKSIAFAESPGTTTQSSNSTTRGADTSPKTSNTNTSYVPNTDLNNSSLEKYSDLLKKPAPQGRVLGYLMLKNNRIFVYFESATTHNTLWGGIYDVNKNKYVAYADGLNFGKVQELENGLCFYKYTQERPQFLSAAHIYNYQLQLQKAVDLTSITVKNRIMSACVSYEGSRFVYAVYKNKTSTIYSVDLDLRDTKTVLSYKSPQKSNQLSEIYTIQNVSGDTIVFGGNAYVPGDGTLMGIGCVSIDGKDLKFQPVGYAWFDTKSPLVTSVSGSLDMYDTSYNGTAYVLDHTTKKITKVQFKNKNESALVVVSQNGKYVGTVQSDILRLYEVSTSRCIKESVISGASNMSLSASMISIDDAKKRVYLNVNDSLYVMKF